MDYKEGDIQPFEVLPKSADDNLFYLGAIDPHGEYAEVTLEKLQFQTEPDYELPKFLDCRIAKVKDGLPVLRHHIPAYVNTFYRETHRNKESAEFTVTYVPLDRVHDKYRLKDSHGLEFKLHDRNALLRKGQKVAVKFVSLSSQGYQIKIDNESVRLPFYNIDVLFSNIGIPSHMESFLFHLWNSAPLFENAVADHGRKEPLWFVTLAHRLLENIPWDIPADKIRRHCASLLALLDVLGDGILFFLEGSGFLNNVSMEYRRNMQGQLTRLVESIKPLRKTLQLIETGNTDSFVERLLGKLEKSGYLYHPDQAFGVMMMIFRLFPDKVSHYLNKIFQTILERNIENWEREPFRTAFVEQFEIYLREATARINEFPSAATREQKDHLLTVITAIAMQIMLDNSNPGISMTYSQFYRYVSLLRTEDSRLLLGQALFSLLGGRPSAPIVYPQLREPMSMVITAAAGVSHSDIFDRLDGNLRYVNGPAEFVINHEGMRLTHIGKTPDTESVIPSSLMKWIHPTVRINGIHGLSGAKIKRMVEHQKWWTDIERALFSSETSRAAEHYDVIKRNAEAGDILRIAVESVENVETGNPKFLCRIADYQFNDGRGYFLGNEAVGFNIRFVTPDVYLNSDGTPKVIEAEVAEVDDDDTCHFNIRRLLEDRLRDRLSVSEEYSGVVVNSSARHPNGQIMCLAVADGGFNVFLEKQPDLELSNSDIVRLRLNSSTELPRTGYVTSLPPRGSESFSTVQALSNALDLLRPDGQDDEDGEEMEEIEDIYEDLTAAEIREIVEIVRFHAINETDLLAAFDYLCFGRILALMIDDHTLVDRLSTHAALLLQHDFFASNSRIDAEALEPLRGRCGDKTLLSDIFHRLELVSWLDRPEHNGRLHEEAQSEEDTLNRSIAQMILSYNMMAGPTEESGKICKLLRDNIGAKLNAANRDVLGKYYGTETKFLELKTSIIYRAVKPGQPLNPDPEAQLDHILSRVAGLLNSEGGKLYIGVNDQGYAAGLRDDFDYLRRSFKQQVHTSPLTRHLGKVKDASSMQVFLGNLLDSVFGPEISSKLSVSIDEDELNREKGRDVLCIEVKKSWTPVFYPADDRAHLYVRLSSENTKRCPIEELSNYISDRKWEYDESVRRSAVEKSAPSSVSPKAAEAVTRERADSSGPEVPAAGGNVESPVAVSCLRTSGLRKSAVSDMDFYSYHDEPFAYLYFDGEEGFVYSTRNLYLDDKSALTLTVPEDLKNGYLLLGYENCEPVKIPLDEIYEKKGTSAIRYNSRYPLRFAAIASDSESVLTVVANNSGQLYYRVEPVSELESSHLNSEPECAVSDWLNHIFLMDLVSATSTAMMRDVCKSRFKKRALGKTLRVNEKDSAVAGVVDELLQKCHI